MPHLLPRPPETAPVPSCAAIVLFYPDHQAWANVIALAAQADCLLVVDNTPLAAPPPTGLPPGVRLLRNHNRGGIAGALNQAATTARELAFTHLVFLDQDSLLPAGFVRRMIDFCQQQRADLAGPRVFEAGSGAYLKYKRIRAFSLQRFDTGTLTQPVEVSFMVTSGSVLDLGTYARVGPFRDDFFIDFVDTEYCLRLQRAGGRLLINPAVEIRHTIGASRALPVLGRFKLISNRHAAWRRYFIGFNGARTSRLYASRYPVFAVWTGLIVVKEALAILVLDDADRLRRARALLGGYAAGWWRARADNPYMPGGVQGPATGRP